MAGLMAAQTAAPMVAQMAALRAYRWVVRKGVPRAAMTADYSGDSKAAR